MSAIIDFIKGNAQMRGEDTTFIYFRDEKISYKEYINEIYRIANGLLDLGLKPGDRCSILMRNCPEFLILRHALEAINVGVVPINTEFKGESLRYLIDLSEVKGIAVDLRLLDNYEPIRDKVPGIKSEVFLGKYGGPIEKIEESEKVRLYSSLLKFSPTPPEISEGTPLGVSMSFTSGTTGPPKGIVISSDVDAMRIWGLLETWEIMRNLLGESKLGETFYTGLPLFHGNAGTISYIGAIYLGYGFALGERFSASRYFDECRKYNAVEFNTLGPMIPWIMGQSERPDDADNPVKVVADAGCPPAFWREFEKRFKIKLIEAYAMMDAPGTLINVDGPVGSMGKPIGSHEFKVVNPETGEEMPPGEVGELVFRVKGLEKTPTLYYKMPEKTEDAWKGGWYHSGDLAYRDEEGWLYFAGRLKGAIRKAGENISVWEIETVIDQHPKVYGTAAVGVPYELGEEEVKVVIEVEPEKKLTPEEIIAYCEKNMPYFQIPRYIEFVKPGEIPRTATHRPIIIEVREKFGKVTPETWDRIEAGVLTKREIEKRKRRR